MTSSLGLAAAFDLQGHRGARGLFPENTLAGFAGALALGVRSLELDVALTRDGALVVAHDPELNPEIVREAGGAWLAAPGPAICTLSMAELARLDVGRLRPGGALASQFPAQAPHDGARIPLLAEVLALAAPAGVVVDVELKTMPDRPALTAAPEALAEAVIAVLREAAASGAAPRLALRSFDWRGLHHVRRHYPAIPLAYLTSPQTERDAALWWGGTTRGEGPHATVQAVAEAARGAAWTPIWAPQHAGLRQDEITAAQALGLRVVPWTVNQPAEMDRLIAWGVDGLCTDRPDLARQAMQRAGLTLPPGFGPGA